jgi:hypothetical protein
MPILTYTAPWSRDATHKSSALRARHKDARKWAATASLIRCSPRILQGDKRTLRSEDERALALGRTRQKKHVKSGLRQRASVSVAPRRGAGPMDFPVGRVGALPLLEEADVGRISGAKVSRLTERSAHPPAPGISASCVDVPMCQERTHASQQGTAMCCTFASKHDPLTRRAGQRTLQSSGRPRFALATVHQGACLA